MLSAVWVALALISPGSNSAAQAKQVFAECNRRLAAAKAVSGKLVGTMRGQDQPIHSSAFLLQKPRSFRSTGGSVELYSDGKTRWNHIVSERQYFREPVVAGTPVEMPPLVGLCAFFGLGESAALPYIVEGTDYRMAKLSGRKCAVRTLRFASYGRGDHADIYIDAAEKMPVGWDQEFGGVKVAYRYKALRFVKPMANSQFTWKPPAGVTEKKATRS